MELPDGEYMYKHAEAPTRDLEYEELARVVEAARSLNFYERVRPWDDLRRIMKRSDVSSVRVDDRGMTDLEALRQSCAKLQKRIAGSARRSLTRCQRVKALVEPRYARWASRRTRAASPKDSFVVDCFASKAYDTSPFAWPSTDPKQIGFHEGPASWPARFVASSRGGAREKLG